MNIRESILTLTEGAELDRYREDKVQDMRNRKYNANIDAAIKTLNKNAEFAIPKEYWEELFEYINKEGNTEAGIMKVKEIFDRIINNLTKSLDYKSQAENAENKKRKFQNNLGQEAYNEYIDELEPGHTVNIYVQDRTGEKEPYETKGSVVRKNDYSLVVKVGPLNSVFKFVHGRYVDNNTAMSIEMPR